MNLEERLRERIRREGPISFYEWMKAALYDEREGYYCRRDCVRQGRQGDYRTAPETSPLFAATFARYFAKLFADLGAPKSLTIIEIGAGNGEFAHGLLKNLKSNHPDVFAATGYVIDEIGPASRAQALERLSDFEGKVTFQRVGSSHVSNDNFPKLAVADRRATDTIIFSNELIDAMPVHRVTMREGKLRELCVGSSENRFFWIDCEPKQDVSDYCRRVGLNLAEGQTAEINLDAEDFIARVAASIERGFVVTVDYGAERDELLSGSHRFAGTLRGFHNHQLTEDSLAHPGEQDLTTTVDWTQLREAGEGAGLQTVQDQRLDKFLMSEGLLDLLENLVAAAQDDVEALQLRTSAREMILPNGLAASFQVLIQRKSS
ncbi:MAG: SAM-dependent methyltransferase [Pyrinomonadaceae bacterium]